MRKWFEALEREVRLFFCRFPQIGLLRLVTNAAVMGQDGVSVRPTAQVRGRALEVLELAAEMFGNTEIASRLRISDAVRRPAL